MGQKFQTLQKISRSGTQREWVFAAVQEFSPKNYPALIAPDGQGYYSYTRAAQ
jgi:hypothetical protein